MTVLTTQRAEATSTPTSFHLRNAPWALAAMTLSLVPGIADAQTLQTTATNPLMVKIISRTPSPIGKKARGQESEKLLSIYKKLEADLRALPDYSHSTVSSVLLAAAQKIDPSLHNTTNFEKIALIIYRTGPDKLLQYGYHTGVEVTDQKISIPIVQKIVSSTPIKLYDVDKKALISGTAVEVEDPHFTSKSYENGIYPWTLTVQSFSREQQRTSFNFCMQAYRKFLETDTFPSLDLQRLAYEKNNFPLGTGFGIANYAASSELMLEGVCSANDILPLDVQHTSAASFMFHKSLVLDSEYGNAVEKFRLLHPKSDTIPKCEPVPTYFYAVSALGQIRAAPNSRIAAFSLGMLMRNTTTTTFQPTGDQPQLQDSINRGTGGRLALEMLIDSVLENKVACSMAPLAKKNSRISALLALPTLVKDKKLFTEILAAAEKKLHSANDATDKLHAVIERIDDERASTNLANSLKPHGWKYRIQELAAKFFAEGGLIPEFYADPELTIKERGDQLTKAAGYSGIGLVGIVLPIAGLAAILSQRKKNKQKLT